MQHQDRQTLQTSQNFTDTILYEEKIFRHHNLWRKASHQIRTSRMTSVGGTKVLCSILNILLLNLINEVKRRRSNKMKWKRQPFADCRRAGQDKFLIFLLQNHIFNKMTSLKTPKLLRTTHFSWGKIWFEKFAPCKRIDILQLWPFADCGRTGQDRKNSNLLGGEVQSPWRPTNSHTEVRNPDSCYHRFLQLQKKTNRVISAKIGTSYLPSVLIYLILRGAKLNIGDHQKITPLLTAVLNGNTEVVSFLLK